MVPETKMQLTEWHKEEIRSTRQELIAEEPLSIRVEGKPYSVVMRTPGDELAHAAGFCLAEGLVDDPEDLASLGVCDDGDTNVVTITLSAARRPLAAGHLDRRGFISQTSCGICGKEIVKDLHQQIRPIEYAEPIDGRGALKRLENISAHQPLRQRTRAAHAALIFDARFELISAAEDVGRHNALDKAVGKLFIKSRLQQAAFLVLSSRISYELVQKAARARIPLILALSRPTSLAVHLAEELKITLASRQKNGALTIYTVPERLTF
jgi:FdhD protein